MGHAYLARVEWKLYRIKNILRLKNKNPTILSANCNGAFILHDLQCEFNSPTVNLYFTAKDFLKFVSNPIYYLNVEPVELKTPLPYPVGKIQDITLFFQHYKTFDEAKNKWLERSKRVNYDNCFIMMTDKNGCTYEDLLAFDKLPYEHKVVFTHVPHPEIKSAFYIKGFEDKNECGVLSDFVQQYKIRRWLDQFDYVSFLNGKGIR